MFEVNVLPKVRSMAGEIYVKRRLLRVSGIGESAVDELIAPIYTAYKDVQTSILFQQKRDRAASGRPLRNMSFGSRGDA